MSEWRMSWTGPFSVGTGNRTRGHRQKLEHGSSHEHKEELLCYLGYCNKFPSEVVEPPWRYSKSVRTQFWVTCSRESCLSREAPGGSPVVPCHSVILWNCRNLHLKSAPSRSCQIFQLKLCLFTVVKGRNCPEEQKEQSVNDSLEKRT